jgi:diaminopimelate epimerase
MKFTKMSALGNDFLIVDGTKYQPEKYQKLTKQLCDRHFGVGGDGFIFVLPSTGNCHYKMLIVNADGSIAEMCGNGVRCFALFVESRLGFNSWPLKVESDAGVISIEKRDDGFRVDMGEPKFESDSLPKTEDGKLSIKTEQGNFDVTPISMGNPHAVIFSNNNSTSLVKEVGSKIEKSPPFPNRTNVEFMEVLSKTEINLRVWERGCGETLACGTGTCAAVVAGIKEGELESRVTAHLLGGDLLIEWSGKSVFMSGKAQIIFEGEIEL